MTDPLSNTRHERFAVLVAGGATAGAAYLQVWPEAKGARQSASRLLTNANVQARIATLRGEIATNLLQSTIRDKQNRLQALQNRCQLLHQLREIRAAEYRGIEALAALVDPASGELDPDGYAEWARAHPRLAAPLREPGDVYRLIEQGTPAGVTGLILRDFRGKSAEQVVFKVDYAWSAELRALEKQAAMEVGDLVDEGEGAGAGRGTAVQVNIAFVQPPAGEPSGIVRTRA